jgi:glycerophosphoryl diester phosphodiesterase
LTDSAPAGRINTEANVNRPFLIQGHRGAPRLASENTLPSFAAALTAGANSLETDVHLSADGVPVLIHDATLPNGSRVRSLTVEQLAAAGVPTLAELYELVLGETRSRNEMIVDVEIKCLPFRNEPALGVAERAIVDVIQTANAVDQTWVRCFDHRRVRLLRRMMPEVTAVALVDGMAPIDPVSLVRAADAQVYGPDYRFLDEEQIRQCHAAGIRVLPWTINEPEEWERLIAWGVDGMTTDYPDRLVAYLSRKS